MRRIHLTAFGSALAAAALVAAPLSAQQNYPQSLYWGSGLIDIPVAWVPPLSGDMAINYSGKQFHPDPVKEKINYSGSINSQLVMSMALFGRVDLGYAAYSSNPEYGFFGRALLLRQSDLGGNSGMRWFVPSLAVGVRNVGSYSHIDRFGNGYILAPPGADPNAKHIPDALHQNFNTSGTMYGVATKELSLRDFRPTWANMDVSLSVGYGNKLFKDDGGLGAAYASHATGGLFYGAKLDWDVGDRTSIAVMAENNAWDYNVGATLNFRGAQAGIYVTELGASQPSNATTANGSYAYRYQKVAFTLGWQTNLFALLRGDFLQRKEAALMRQRELLLAEIARREQRIAALELEINRYQAQNLLELEQRRTAAEVQLNEERSALKRLEERLRRVEQQLPPSTTPTPPSPTPTPPPSSSAPTTTPAPSTTPTTTPTPSTTPSAPAPAPTTPPSTPPQA